jgi:uncharacterized tellurite resistance protein B-like protein
VLKAIKALLLRGAENTPELILGDLTPELRLAMTALFCEVVRADQLVSEAEMEVVESLTLKAFGLSVDEVRELVDEAKTTSGDERSFGKYSRHIDTSLSVEQKRYLLELLWTCALSDDRLERNEDYLVRKVGKAMNLNPLDIIDAKQRAEVSAERRRGEK